jgi:phage-related protein
MAGMSSRLNLTRFNLLSSDSIREKTVVSFDGIGIGSAVQGAQVINIEIGAAGIETRTLDKVFRAGNYFRSRRNTTRPVTVTVELPLDRDTYADNVRRVIEWASSSEPKALMLEVYPGMELYAVLTDVSSFTQKNWWEPVTLTFTANDPYFQDIALTHENVGTQFTVAGDAPVSLKITHVVSSTLTQPQWTIDNGDYIKLTGTYSSGTIVIDMEHFTVTRNGTPIAADIALTSRFQETPTGSHIVTGPAGGLVEWRERWL